MTDLEICKQSLGGHAVVFCLDGNTLAYDQHGIRPLMKAIADNANLVGYAVADKIVGKAAAMLLVKLGVSAVYGEVASVGGVEFLRAHGVEVSYGSLVPYIVNRDKTGCCPMEQAVKDATDVEVGYRLLAETCQILQKRTVD